MGSSVSRRIRSMGSDSIMDWREMAFMVPPYVVKGPESCWCNDLMFSHHGKPQNDARSSANEYPPICAMPRKRRNWRTDWPGSGVGLGRG